MTEVAAPTVEGYRVENLLGVIGMVEVYRAINVDLNRLAVIKIVRADLAINPDFLDRFVPEGLSLVHLRHPNIVEVYDFGDDEGRYYFVMEWIKDGTLRTLLQRRQSLGEEISLPFGVDLIRQAALGIAYANSQDIFHGDVKPDNIFLQRSGPDSYVAKASDFGLSRLVEAGAATVQDIIIGSLAYMSPERLDGAEIDARSDVYSLGVVLYELTTGYLPFDTKSYEDALYKHSYTEPTAPRRINSAMPEALEEIIQVCLAKRPDDRFKTVDALASALESLGGPSQAPAPVTTDSESSENILLTTLALERRVFPDPPVDRFVPTVNRPTTLPRVYIVDQHGQGLESAEVGDTPLSIGRESDNTLALKDDSVSRYHVRVERAAGGVQVTDLRSTNGSLLDGVPLVPHEPHPWRPGQWLYLNPFWLWVEIPDVPATVGTESGELGVPGAVMAPTAPVSVVEQAADRIRVELDRTAIELIPGRLVVFNVMLSNVGRLVDHFTVSVEGVPPWWIQGVAPTVRLNPGRQGTVPLHVLVPESPDSRAGDYAVTVRARSQQNPTESGTAQAIWMVTRYVASVLELVPRRRTTWRGASYIVGLENRGNAQEQYTLAALDDEERLDYQFSRETWVLDPATATRLPLRVRAPIVWIGANKYQGFTVEARSGRDASAQTTRGELMQRAIIPIWLVPFILLALVGAVLVARLLFVPAKQLAINTFTVQPLTINVGTPVTITWNVKNARKVQLIRQTIGESGKPIVQNVGLSGSTQDLPRHNTRYGLVASRLVEAKPVKYYQIVNVLPAPTPTGTPKPTAAPPAAAKAAGAGSGAASGSGSGSKSGSGSGSGAGSGSKTGSGGATKPAPKPAGKSGTTSKPAPKPVPKAAPVAKSTPSPVPTPKPQPTLPSTAPFVKSIVGNWSNINGHPQYGALSSLSITRLTATTLSVTASYACPQGQQGQCSLGTVKVPVPAHGTLNQITAKFPVTSLNGQPATGDVSVTVSRVGLHLLHALVVNHVNGCTMCPSHNSYLIVPTGTPAQQSAHSSDIILVPQR